MSVLQRMLLFLTLKNILLWTRIVTWLDTSNTVPTQILLQSILHERNSFSYSTPVETKLGFWLPTTFSLTAYLHLSHSRKKLKG